MYIKYSNIMNLVFVAFTHGLYFPLLWPIATFGLINSYVVERLCLAYYYKQPPMLDNKLNLKALGFMQYAPLSLFAFGYWALGNRQMFFNEIEPKTTQLQELAYTNHTLGDPGWHACPLIIAFVIFLLQEWYIKYVTRALRCLKCLKNDVWKANKLLAKYD